MGERFQTIPWTVLVLTTVIPLIMSGCKEADFAIDVIVGKRSPALLLSSTTSPLTRFLPDASRALKSRSGISPYGGEYSLHNSYKGSLTNSALTEKIMLVTSDTLSQDDLKLRRVSQPGAPTTIRGKTILDFDFTFPRDPFMPPSEAVPPSECLPSMPLCRYDYTQLKLRGLMRLADGQYKGMVEDPDGRGFFITPGIQIRGATVTQVTGEGVILYVHKTKKIDWLRIEGREAKGY